MLGKQPFFKSRDALREQERRTLLNDKFNELQLLMGSNNLEKCVLLADTMICIESLRGEVDELKLRNESILSKTNASIVSLQGEVDELKRRNEELQRQNESLQLDCAVQLETSQSKRRRVDPVTVSCKSRALSPGAYVPSPGPVRNRRTSDIGAEALRRAKRHVIIYL